MNALGQSPFGQGMIDPNTSRLIEETAAVVNDVDQRLTALKVGLSQALPHLAPVLLWKEQLALSNPIARTQAPGAFGSPMTGGFGSPFSGQGGFGSPFGSPFNAGIFGQIGPQVNPFPYAQGIYGNPLSQVTPQTFGTGVTYPLGIGSPFRPF